MRPGPDAPVVALDIDGHKWKVEHPSIQACHYRIYVTRGKASQHCCVDCGTVAEHWSQIRDSTGYDPAHYEPRCRSCHNKYDWDTCNVVKLSPDEVVEIRRLYGTGEYYQRQLAELFGVTQSTISVIINKLTWSQL